MSKTPSHPPVGGDASSHRSPYFLKEIQLLQTLREKHKSWTEIHAHYNASVEPSRERSLDALQKKWRHLLAEERGGSLVWRREMT
jgi:Myb/SANT-like DNA-binding domain